MAAIVPNSGITKVPIISISSAPAGNAMVSILSVDVVVSSKSTSSPSIKTKKSSSSPLIIASNTDLGIVRVNEPSSSAWIDMISEFASKSVTMPSSFPPVISYPIKSLEPETLTVVSVITDSTSSLDDSSVEPPVNTNDVVAELLVLSPYWTDTVYVSPVFNRLPPAAIVLLNFLSAPTVIWSRKTIAKEDDTLIVKPYPPRRLETSPVMVIVSPSAYDSWSVSTYIELCPNAGAIPILAIKIADRANTDKWVFINFTPKFTLFKVVKNFIDK